MSIYLMSGFKIIIAFVMSNLSDNQHSVMEASW